jgi:hypothetical protein
VQKTLLDPDSLLQLLPVLAFSTLAFHRIFLYFFEFVEDFGILEALFS